MKKIMIVLLTLLVVMAAAVGVFIATFDVNRFKPLLIQNLEKALGKPVAIGPISLAWKNGLAVELRDVAVYPDSDRKGEPKLKLASVTAGMRLCPLLQKNIQLTSVNLDSPSIEITRDRQGKLLVGGVDLAGKTSAKEVSPSDSSATPENALMLSADSIGISNGNVVWVDSMAAKPVRLEITDLQVRIRHFSPDKPFSVEVSANIFGKKSNAQIKTRVHLPSGSAPVLNETLLKTDLSLLDLEKLTAAFGPQAAGGLQAPLEGELTASFTRLELSPNFLQNAAGTIYLKKAKITHASLKGESAHEIDLSAVLNSGTAASEGKFGIFSESQNVIFSGKLDLPIGSRPAMLREFGVDTDLAKMDLNRLKKVCPSLGEAGLRGGLSGHFSARLDHWTLAGAVDSASNQGSVAIRDGRVPFAGFDQPIDRIQFTAGIRGSEIELSRLDAEVFGAPVAVKGKVIDYLTRPAFYVQGSVKDLPLLELVKTVKPDSPQIQGHLSVEFEGDAKSFAWEGISQTLNGRARVRMNDGVLLNYNILREIIQKISVIPGAEEAIRSNFPKLYQMKMQENSTILNPVDLEALIQNGVFYIDPLLLSTEFIGVSGVGEFALDRRMKVRAHLILNQEISGALTGAFNPVQILANNVGEIVIPVTVEGELPQVKIIPDKEYIASKLLGGTTSEVVQNLVTDPKKTLEGFRDMFKKTVQS